MLCLLFCICRVFHCPTLLFAGFKRKSWYITDTALPSHSYWMLPHPPPPHTQTHTHTVQTHTHIQTSCCSAGWQSAPVPVVRTEQPPSLCPQRLCVPAAAEPGLWRIWQEEGNTGEMLRTKPALTLKLNIQAHLNPYVIIYDISQGLQGSGCLKSGLRGRNTETGSDKHALTSLCSIPALATISYSLNKSLLLGF